MADAVDPIREFVLVIEKTLITRRLYAPHMAPFKEANGRVYEKCRAAVGDGGFTLRVGTMDLFVGKTSVLNRPKLDESYFFPLYRDGLRELTFGPDVSREELEALLETFEAQEKRKLGPTDDTVSHLWRCDLQTITYNAVDGIGDQESEGDDEGGAAGGDYRALVADLAAKIQNPAAAETGQSYAFVMDADVKVAATDLHYQATTTRKTFDENPRVLQLSSEEAQALRAEVDKVTDSELLERFLEIVFTIMGDPVRAVAPTTFQPVLERLLEGYWQGGDHHSAFDVIARVQGLALEAPTPEGRAAARELVVKFLSVERMKEVFAWLQKKTIPLQIAAYFWDVAGDGAFDAVMEFGGGLPEGELKTAVINYLKSRVAARPDRLRSSLATTASPARVRLALTLLDTKLDSYFSPELLGLAGHADENVRMKGIAAAGRLGGPAALDVVWKAMEADPSKSVRLIAFRVMSTSSFPGLADHLKTLISSAAFQQRPAWEREKYARLLAACDPDTARPIVEAWIPRKSRWFWKDEDTEQAEVALRSLASCGPEGLAQVQALMSDKGPVGEIARIVFESRKDRAAVGDSSIIRMTTPPDGRTTS